MPDISFDAKLSFDDVEVQPTSWFISHGLGTAAGNTFTEVVIERQVTEDIGQAIARSVAGQLYGVHWAFIYRPAEYAGSIRRHGMQRRERVVVTGIEVWS